MEQNCGDMARKDATGPLEQHVEADGERERGDNGYRDDEKPEAEVVDSTRSSDAA